VASVRSAKDDHSNEIETLFAYLVTTKNFTPTAIGLWGLCFLYFSGTIFTVKLRKTKTEESFKTAFQRFAAYHAIALCLCFATTNTVKQV